MAVRLPGPAEFTRKKRRQDQHSPGGYRAGGNKGTAVKPCAARRASHMAQRVFGHGFRRLGIRQNVQCRQGGALLLEPFAAGSTGLEVAAGPILLLRRERAELTAE